MKYKRKKLVNLLFIVAIVLVSAFTVFGFQYETIDKRVNDDPVMMELRPFDFNDAYYEANGVWPEAIIGRRTGFDKYSIIDYINSDHHRNVRLIGTSASYSYDGKVKYCVIYGDLYKQGFTKGEAGVEAKQIAERFPIYLFPSDTMPGKFRQTAVIEDGPGYFEKNPLGVGLVVFVEYTNRIKTKKAAYEIEYLLKLNGANADGTPILRSVAEIMNLTRMGLVRQTKRDWFAARQPGYALVRVFKNAEGGGISPDAYLMMAKDRKGRVLDREKVFVDEFGCLQKAGTWCSDIR